MVRRISLAFAFVVSGCSQPAEVVKDHPGEPIYAEKCFSCHTPGLSGAPKLGDAEAWAPRAAKGAAALLQTTVEGIPPAMPPRGACGDCTDQQLIDAIDFMVKSSQ